MKICPKCGNALPDEASFCTLCGAKCAATSDVQPEAPRQENPQQAPNQEAFQQNVYQPYQQPIYTQPAYDPADHTAEFDAKDISDNKVLAMLVYLTSVVGIVLAAWLGAKESPYVTFHVRQGLKFFVVDILLGVIAGVLCWTFIVPIAAGICYVILFILRVICFVQVCKNEAKDAAIIRSLGFLK